MMRKYILPVICGSLLWTCKTAPENNQASRTNSVQVAPSSSSIEQKLGKYATIKLTADLGKLTDKEKQMIKLLIEASKQMDDIFWQEAFGDKNALLDTIKDESLRRYVTINYGPWDRLDNENPFIPSFGKKPDGANFYPVDMTKEEFEKANLPDKKSNYTILRRDASGKLITVPYHEAFKDKVTKAADLLKQAATLAEDPGLKNYLNLRAEALLTDKYQQSDIAWLDMKNNSIDVVIGPIETYEDQLFGYKASYEGYVLIKDKEWSKRLAKYAAMLPELQRGIPVSEAYKTEKPGSNSDLNAYDVVYYAGDCNAGSKTIAINLPNDEQVQLQKGTRRLQLKNTMRAKFDQILLPIAERLIAPDQRKHITFDAFFANVMFHEVAHGLGIKNTVGKKDAKGQKLLVRDALKENSSAVEEGKADILGLYMITKLFEKGEIKEGTLMDNYVTFMAGILRSVRFGASSAHGRANMLCFNHFHDNGAFSRNADGTYSVNFEKMQQAMNGLSEKILVFQGDGNYEGVSQWIKDKGEIGADLQTDLNKLEAANIPVDIVFEQGAEVLGL